jgi:hypothetical protein
MARPESIKDIKHDDRFVRIAMFEIEKFIGNPALLKHYTAILETAQKLGGRAEKSYSTVDVSIPKDDKQLADQLQSDQYYWDDKQKYYNLALNRGANSDEIPEWRHSGIKEWAKQEGLPDPFDVFAANDPELQRLRDELGLDNDE